MVNPVSKTKPNHQPNKQNPPKTPNPNKPNQKDALLWRWGSFVFFYLTIAIKCPIQFFALLNDKYLYGLTGNPQIHQ